ncbi:MAG: hypothetical protein A3H31_07940 [Gallionellales bacterium RIFCSPLOWO2_02_FULL_57_47]|nr:MAG: hypothetical protein A3H31_07940 [Gallionellales bacterium RIFCSPLOWO2_02_FULL_57_47]OGT15959.1 MAG: hypothetical protein A3J49_07655 [Gallionellales bacterium RIFCSPHIGHO2_02_FULL_57_16]
MERVRIERFREAMVFHMLVNNWQLYDNFGTIDMGRSFIFFTKFNKAPSLQITFDHCMAPFCTRRTQWQP